MSATVINETTVSLAQEIRGIVNSGVSFTEAQLQSLIDATGPASVLVSSGEVNGIPVCRRVRNENNTLRLSVAGLPAYEVTAKSATQIKVSSVVMFGQYKGETYCVEHALLDRDSNGGPEVKELIIAEPCAHPPVSPEVGLPSVNFPAVRVAGKDLTDVEFDGVFILDMTVHADSTVATVGYADDSTYSYVVE